MKKKLKSSHSRQRSRTRFSLKWLLLIAVFAIGFSLFSAFKSGTGPLSFLAQTADINIVTSCAELEGKACSDAGCTWTPPKTTSASTISKACSNSDCDKKKDGCGWVTKTTSGCSLPGIKNKNLCTAEGGKWSATATNEKTCTGTYKVNGETKTIPGSCSGTPNPANQKGNQSSTASGCPGNIAVQEGQTVASGKMFGDDPNKRECVTCRNGRYVNARACDVAFQEDPKNTILPVDAGYQYTGGTREAPVKAPDACVTGSGNVATGNYNAKNEYCFDGKWYPSDKVDDKATQDIFASFCSDYNPPRVYDVILAQCVPQQAALTPGDPTSLTSPASCGSDQVLRDDGKCHYVTCNLAGKNKGGCKADEICTSVARGMICKATANVIPTIKKVCNDNLLGIWNDNEYKWNNTYCPAGCDNIKKECKPTPAVIDSQQPSTPALTPAQQSNLTDPTKPWSATNPTKVEGGALCPYGTGRQIKPDLNRPDKIICYPKEVTSPDTPIAPTSGTQVGGTTTNPDKCKYPATTITKGSVYGCPTVDPNPFDKKAQPVPINLKEPDKAQPSFGDPQSCKTRYQTDCVQGDDKRWYLPKVTTTLNTTLDPNNTGAVVTEPTLGTQVGGTTTNPDDCMYPPGSGSRGRYTCPLTDPNAQQSTTPKGTIIPGGRCGVNADASCSSGECSLLNDPVRGNHWTCMAPSTFDRPAGASGNTNVSGKKYNKIYCSNNDECISGYCASFTFGNKLCANNPFTPQSSMLSSEGIANPGTGVSAPSQPTYTGNTNFLVAPQCSDEDIAKARARNEFCGIENGKPVFTKYSEVNLSAPIQLSNQDQTQLVDFDCPTQVIDITGLQLNDQFVVNTENGEQSRVIARVEDNSTCGLFNTDQSELNIFGCYGDQLFKNFTKQFTRTVPANNTDSPLVADCTRLP